MDPQGSYVSKILHVKMKESGPIGGAHQVCPPRSTNVVDKQNGHMMGIFDDKLEDIDCDAQMKPFNLAQLSQMIATLEQRKQGFNDSSVSDNTNAPNNNRLQCPSTPKEFKSFDSLKELGYDGNMLTPEERSGLYQDHTKVILEMAEAYNVFSRCIYFNPEMSDKYQNNIDRYIRYYTNIIRHVDIFLQEDQLMCTRLGFPLVPVPCHIYPTCMNWNTVISGKLMTQHLLR